MAQPQTAPDLISLLDHHNANIRAYSKVALAEISSKFFGDDKEKWHNWWRQYQQKHEQVAALDPNHPQSLERAQR
jgi:hypothetical protein